MAHLPIDEPRSLAGIRSVLTEGKTPLRTLCRMARDHAGRGFDELGQGFIIQRTRRAASDRLANRTLPRTFIGPRQVSECY